MSLVLVADDEPAVLEVLTEVVEDLGHEVVRALDGREALTLARAKRPHLVVTDHMMPRLSGVELCRALRRDEALSSVPVILLSAALPPEAVEAHAYLAKPFELDEFEALVRRTLESVGATAGAAPSGRVLHPAGGTPEEILDWAAEALRAPLVAARMNLGRNGDRLPPHLDAVSRQLERMDRIVAALLDASSLNAGRLELRVERLDLRDVVREAVERWRADHPGGRVDLVLPQERITVRGDPPRLQQILMLVLDHGAPRGEDAGPIRVVLARRGPLAEVRIRQSADGADRTDPGLYIAAELARRHGGGITRGDRRKGGTDLVITVPLA